MSALDAELTKLAATVEPMEVKALGDGTLILKGIAATFGIDRTGERFDGASFRRAFDAFMAGPAPVVTFNHRLSQLLGRVLSHKYVGDGVEVEVEVPKPADGTPELANAYRMIKAGILRGFSVGGKWARKVIGGDTVLFPSEFVELTIAPIPANAAATFDLTGIKSLPDLDGELATLAELTAGPSPLDEQLSRLRTL